MLTIVSPGPYPVPGISPNIFGMDFREVDTEWETDNCESEVIFFFKRSAHMRLR